MTWQTAKIVPFRFAASTILRQSASVARLASRQHVIAQVGERDRRVNVHGVLCSDDYPIGELWPGRQLAPIGKTKLGRNPMLLGEPILVELARLGHANDLNLIGMIQCILRVAGATNSPRRRLSTSLVASILLAFLLRPPPPPPPPPPPVSQGTFEIKVAIRALASTIPHRWTQRRPSLALLRPPYSMGVNS